MTQEEIEAELRKPDGVIVMSKEEIDALVTTYSKPTTGLRFVDGRLHQAFEVESWQFGKRKYRAIEWREVPSVTTADANSKKD